MDVLYNINYLIIKIAIQTTIADNLINICILLRR